MKRPEEEIKNKKRDRSVTENFAAYLLFPVRERFVSVSEKEYRFIMNYIHKPIEKFNRLEDCPILRMDKFTHWGISSERS